MSASTTPSVTDPITLTGYDAVTMHGLPTSIRSLAEHIGEAADWPRLSKAQRSQLGDLYSWARNIAETVERLTAKGSA